jgi:lysophospholipase L1-like esterase
VTRPQTLARQTGRKAVIALAVLLLALATACGSSSSGGSSPSSSPTASGSAAALPSTPGDGKAFYVSIGDSYAAGYQPTTSRKVGHTTTNGFAYKVADQATVGGKQLTLVNFGCAGATTGTLLNSLGCRADRLGPGAAGYPAKTQAQAALDFIAAHRAQVGLISVVIGGNDITKCATAKDVAGCLTTNLKTVKANLATFLTKLHAAAGQDIVVVGLTYPDVILGLYVSKTPALKSLAAVSVTAFKSLVNPALKAEYDAAHAIFIDVTSATDAYAPFTQTTTLAPYGTIPQSVAKTCQLTFYCQFQDIHPRTNGYQLIADLIKKAIPPA